MISVSLQEELRRNGSVTLTLKVIPRASKDELAGILDDGSWKVKVTAVPENGKANAAVCRLLAAEFHVPERNVEIVRGGTSHHKQVRVTLR